MSFLSRSFGSEPHLMQVHSRGGSWATQDAGHRRCEEVPEGHGKAASLAVASWEGLPYEGWVGVSWGFWSRKKQEELP